MFKHALTKKRPEAFGLRRFLAIALAVLLAVSGLGSVAAEGESGSITVSKVDEAGKALAGASLELRNSQGTVVASWVSGETPHVVQGLPFGTYTLRETEAPAGYKGAEDIPVVLAPTKANVIQPGTSVNVSQGTTGYSKAISMNGTAAYCLDRHTYFNGQVAGNSSDLSAVGNSGVPGDLENSGRIIANKDRITRALMVGYPNDALGIGQKYNLSEKDFNRVTQDIIWKLVNGVEPGAYDTDQADYAAHQDPRYKVYYQEFMDAVMDDTLDTSGYDATIYWTGGSQPVVGALYSKTASAEVTMVNEKLPTVKISLSKKWVDNQSNTVTDTQDQWARFQLYRDGAAYGDPVTLNSSTGWTHTFDNLPAGYKYEVKEVASSGDGLDANPQIEYTTVTTPEQTIARTETKKGLKEVAPQVGGTYIIHVETWNEKDGDGGQHNIRVLTDPLSATETPPTNLDSIPAGYQWTLVDSKSGDGTFYLQSDRGNRIYYTSQTGISTFNAALAPSSQTAGAKLKLVSNGDGTYRLRSEHKTNGNYVMYFTNNEIKFVKENTQSASGIENQVRFYQVVTETVTVTETIPGSTQTAGATYSFTNKVMKNFPVKINKEDMNGNEVAGAEIKVYDSEGTEVGKWISQVGETMDLELKPGTYTFEEVSAPDEYQCVETIITFTVDQNGQVTVAKVDVEPAGAVAVENGVIVLKDEIKPEESSTEATEESSTEATEESSTGTTEESSTEATEESSTEATEESSTDATEESSTEATEESSTEATEESSTEATEESSTEATEESSTGTTEETTTATSEEESSSDVTKETTTAVVEEEEKSTTVPDEGGILPPGGGEEEEGGVNAETEVPETNSESDEGGILPPGGEEEEGATVNAETQVPETLAPVVEANPTKVDADTAVPTPDTGDHSQVGLYIGLLAVAMTGTFLLLIPGKHRSKEE